jgi:hypothetical protein
MGAELSRDQEYDTKLQVVLQKGFQRRTRCCGRRIAQSWDGFPRHRERCPPQRHIRSQWVREHL